MWMNFHWSLLIFQLKFNQLIKYINYYLANNSLMIGERRGFTQMLAEFGDRRVDPKQVGKEQTRMESIEPRWPKIKTANVARSTSPGPLEPFKVTRTKNDCGLNNFCTDTKTGNFLPSSGFWVFTIFLKDIWLRGNKCLFIGNVFKNVSHFPSLLLSLHLLFPLPSCPLSTSDFIRLV